MKDGFTHPGHAVGIEGGSHGRFVANLESGGGGERLAYYANVRRFREHGWRDLSESWAENGYAQRGVARDGGFAGRGPPPEPVGPDGQRALPPGTPGTEPGVHLHGAGHYRERRRAVGDPGEPPARRRAGGREPVLAFQRHGIVQRRWPGRGRRGRTGGGRLRRGRWRSERPLPAPAGRRWPRSSPRSARASMAPARTNSWKPWGKAAAARPTT